MAFVANFIRFPAVQKLRFDKVRDSLKVGRFLRHSVYELSIGTKIGDLLTLNDTERRIINGLFCFLSYLISPNSLSSRVHCAKSVEDIPKNLPATEL